MTSESDFDNTVDRYFATERTGELSGFETFRVYVMPDMVHKRGFVLWHRHSDEVLPHATHEFVTKKRANRAANRWAKTYIKKGWREIDQAAWIQIDKDRS